MGSVKDWENLIKSFYSGMSFDAFLMIEEFEEKKSKMIKRSDVYDDVKRWIEPEKRVYVTADEIENREEIMQTAVGAQKAVLEKERRETEKLWEIYREGFYDGKLFETVTEENNPGQEALRSEESFEWGASRRENEEKLFEFFEEKADVQTEEEMLKRERGRAVMSKMLEMQKGREETVKRRVKIERPEEITPPEFDFDRTVDMLTQRLCDIMAKSPEGLYL